MLYHGDCLEVMRGLPAASMDMVLADVPYGMTQNSWDRAIAFEPMWAALNRVAKHSAAIVLMAAQPFAAKLICSNLDDFGYDLIWSKNKATGFLNAKKQPLRAHEHILVFYRSPPYFDPQKTKGHKPGNYARRVQHSDCYGKQTPTEYGGSTERYPLSVLDVPIINNDSADKIHPTQKPVALMEWLIRSYTKPGDTVLDFAMGSGTTGEACRNISREFVGIELQEDYFRAASKRLELFQLTAAQ